MVHFYGFYTVNYIGILIVKEVKRVFAAYIFILQRVTFFT